MPHCLGALQASSTTAWASGSTSSSARASTTTGSPRSSRISRRRAWPSRARARSSSSSRGPRPRSSSARRDGAFTYATTDLATIQYRAETWHPDQVLYVVDSRQGDHFKQLFEVARKWGYDAIDLEHVAFGTILGRRPPAVQDPRGRRRRPGIAARRVGRRGAQGRPGEQPRARPRRAAPRRRRRRHGRDQVRRPLPEPDQRLRLRLAEDDGHERQHRDVSPVRLRPDAEHLPQGRRPPPRRSARHARRSWSATPPSGPWA